MNKRTVFQSIEYSIQVMGRNTPPVNKLRVSYRLNMQTKALIISRKYNTFLNKDDKYRNHFLQWHHPIMSHIAHKKTKQKHQALYLRHENATAAAVAKLPISIITDVAVMISPIPTSGEAIPPITKPEAPSNAEAVPAL